MAVAEDVERGLPRHHHRLIESYLLGALIAAKAGEPSHDPHGSPILGPDLPDPLPSGGERRTA